MKLGESIKKAREDKGWSELRLADECGVNPITIKSWENGDTAPKEVTIKGLELLLGCKLV